jgi:hypothetical protein
MTFNFGIGDAYQTSETSGWWVITFTSGLILFYHSTLQIWEVE